MKTLILYYSRSGHNKKLTYQLSEIIKCDVEEIVDKDPKSFLVSGWHAMKKKKTEIKPIKSDLKKYDQIILSSPFWVGGLPPTTRTFIEQNLTGIKTIGLISVSGGGEKNMPFVDAVEKEYSIKINPRMMISDPEFTKNSYKDELNDFAKKLIGR